MKTIVLTLLIALMATVALAEEVTTFEVVEGKGKITIVNTHTQTQDNLTLEDLSRRLAELEREKVNIANETVAAANRNTERIAKIDNKIKALTVAIKQMPIITEEIN